MEELNVQLNQMKCALEVANEEDKPVLQKIIQDLEELIKNCNSEISGSTNQTSDEPEEDEFLKFQREIAQLENKSDESKPEGSNSNEQDHNIEDELEALKGMKCKAPFEAHWGQIGLYNAAVIDVERDAEKSLQTINVRVLFQQPITKKMVPCQYYLENKCRFSDEECKFSHGCVAPLSELKEHEDADYSKVLPDSTVLAKFEDDGIWYKARISKITESGDCEIVYDKYKESSTVPMHDTFPIDEDFFITSQDNSSSEEEDSNSISSDEELEEGEVNSNIWLLKMKAGSALGVWEQHTKGIGSKLMAQMGYVIGTGLGKNKDGRIEPVDAIVLPPGISLDRCMELKAKAGDSNLFSADKRLKRAKRKEMEKAKRAAERAKKIEETPVFEFLNKHLELKKDTPKNSKNIVNQATQLNKDTNEKLNKRLFEIGEEVKDVTKEIAKVQASIKRLEVRDPTTANKMKLKLSELQKHLNDLKKSETSVSSAKKNRSDLKKSTIF